MRTGETSSLTALGGGGEGVTIPPHPNLAPDGKEQHRDPGGEKDREQQAALQYPQSRRRESAVVVVAEDAVHRSQRDEQQDPRRGQLDEYRQRGEHEFGDEDGFVHNSPKNTPFHHLYEKVPPCSTNSY